MGDTNHDFIATKGTKAQKRSPKAEFDFRKVRIEPWVSVCETETQD
jgi:hypothetical protein